MWGMWVVFIYIVLGIPNKSLGSPKVSGDPNNQRGPKKLQFAVYGQFVLVIL